VAGYRPGASHAAVAEAGYTGPVAVAVPDLVVEVG
jgi:hypothetical protein